MSHRATFTLDTEAYDYLIMAGGENRSAFVNSLLKHAKKRELKTAIMMANLEEAQDTEYQTELSDWDITLSDGV